jgi:hypothetical protein
MGEAKAQGEEGYPHPVSPVPLFLAGRVDDESRVRIIRSPGSPFGICRRIQYFNGMKSLDPFPYFPIAVPEFPPRPC